MIASMLVPALFVVSTNSVSLGSTAASFTPNYKPVIRVMPVEGAIKIDGDLDDSGWIGAAHASNFTEISPGDQVRPPVDTEVLVTYNRTHLFVAFIAHDEPSTIRASLRARDEIFDDDYVALILDTYNNAAWAYQLFMNPLGIQGDKRWTLGSEDVGFDVVFDSKGKITNNGYQVEIAVPFKSLRFPNRDEQIWRVSFMRSHPRDSRRNYSWAAISRDDPCFPCQLGTIIGISGVRPGSSLEFLPSIVGSQSGELRDFQNPDSGFKNYSPDGEASLGVRYGVTSSIGAELTINPDFSQVESDVAQIDVNTTFALFFPERRPFFQEGSDLFRTWWNVVYTRTINDPSVAVKVTSRTEKTSFVVLGARDEHTPLILPFEERSLVVETGKSTSGIFRIRRALKEDSYIGTVTTSRWYDGGGSGTVVGFDGLVRFRQNYRFKAQGLWSMTHEPDKPVLTEGVENVAFDRGVHTVALDGESFTGHGAYASLERDARHWKSSLDYWDSSPTFRADNGFVFRNSDRRLVWANSYVFYPDNRWFDEIRPNSTITRRWNAFNVRKAQSIENWLEVQFKRQTKLSIGYDFNSELFQDVYFDDIRLLYGEFNTDFSDALRFGFWIGVGDRIGRTETPPILGEGEHIDAWATIKPAQNLAIEPVFMYSALSRKDTKEEVFDGYIFRTRINYQFTRELFMRFVVQYDDFTGRLNLEPLLTYELNPFSVFYIGGGSNYLNYSRMPLASSSASNDFEPTEWQVFFKFQYFLRV